MFQREPVVETYDVKMHEEELDVLVKQKKKVTISDINEEVGYQ